MKKLLMLIVSLIMLISTFTVVCAAEENRPVLISDQDDSIKVMQDGEYVDFTDDNGNKVEPQIINSRTMVPFRKIFNSLGVEDENIDWAAETRTVTATKDDVTIELQIDNSIAKKTVSGETTVIELDSAPVIYENRTLVPVRFIAESMEKLVGWDADNRTVIIIDMAKVKDNFEKAMPKYMELVRSQTTPLNTFSSVATLNGEIAYTSEEEKSNNSTLKFNASVDMKKSEDAILIDLSIKFTGKGIIYDTVKEYGLTSIKATFIMKEDKLYITTSLFEGDDAGRWIVLEDESLKDIISLLNSVYANPSIAGESILKISEEDLDIHTYSNLQIVTELLKQFFGDDNIKISGTKTKTYEMKIDFLDIINYFADYGVDPEDVEMFKELSMKAKGTIEDGVAKTSNVEMNLDIEEDGEEIKIVITAKSEVKSYNKSVEIKLPSANELIEE